ncbi:3-hydroxyisobutyrate dehydrogenase [Pseudooceanicola antarcticus]|uniref:3-hydroxyisobutyrate dehydrogenase n=1 Tax=Pseudooceanicola antarcticus TaxID=1247613 RepID=A0A285IX35_9RHOB|nr:NAD(P)-dependent oxidoreductase [Pseudooceanicola antarcticus]PJE25911.1 NAD(P)-dependent oxidoreductase [Pseudooceanicola antarcticus]SNY52393.1 3-hydroxyisobutyrate dehydrogenase [Pseudooceanicola antarcticus]
MVKAAFLGLGVMGYPMAGHLVAAGHDVTVYNRTTAKAEAWVAQHGGAMAPTPAEAVAGADVVMTCVGNDDDLRAVCAGAGGAFEAMKPGAILVDHTTVSARVTSELAAIAAGKGLGFVDAPISGGQAGAENGALSVMCGGAQETFDTVAPIIDAYAKVCRLMGPSGAGQITKMCNQIAIAGVVQGLAEAVNFAQKSGMDGEKVIEVISQGAAGSWQMSNRYQTMLEDHYEHGFAVDWMRKDLGICLSTGDEIGAALPLTALVDQFYKDVQAMGGGRWDTSALLKRLKAFG